MSNTVNIPFGKIKWLIALLADDGPDAVWKRADSDGEWAGCGFCMAWYRDGEPHEEDCPVLVAREVMALFAQIPVTFPAEGQGDE